MDSMPISTRGRKLSAKLITLLSLIFLVILGGVFAITASIANLTGQRIAQTQEVNPASPSITIKRQIKRILLKKETNAGTFFYEIFQNGQVNIYDANMNLLKSGLQGFGRTNSLFDDIDKLMELLKNNLKSGYTLIVETTTGTETYIGTGTGGNKQIDDLIGNIEDLVNDTFAPTPTIAPTHTPVPGQPTRTPTPSPTGHLLNPTVTPTLNPLTPTPLPGYMTAPPFKCEDYDISRPFTISNVMCFPK